MPAKIDLDGQVIVITGASRGIGEAIARAAVEHGAKLVFASRKQGPLDRVAEALRALGGEVFALTRLSRSMSKGTFMPRSSSSTTYASDRQHRAALSILPAWPECARLQCKESTE